MKTTTAATWVLGVGILLSNGPALGFVFLFEERYAVGDTHRQFYVDIPGVSDSGTSWNAAFDLAVADWNTRLAMPLTVVREFRDPCAGVTRDVNGVSVESTGDGFSAADFTDSFCGASYAVLNGVAAAGPNFTVIDGEIVQAETNITFDSSIPWDVYDGPIQGIFIDGVFEALVDFRRVASHELGHALGLAHSIFKTSITSIDDASAVISTPSIDDFCGVAVHTGEPENCEILLPDAARVDGEATQALFFGGASTDKGLTYSSQFSIADTLDVMATVVVAPEHVAQAGKLYVVAVLENGSLFAQNSAGGFVAIEEGETLPAAESKFLNGANELYILEDIALADAGVSNQTLAIFLGYTIDAEPDNIIYSTTPIRFTILP